MYPEAGYFQKIFNYSHDFAPMLKEMHWNFNFQTLFSATSYFLYIISSCGFILGLFGCRSFWFALTYACAIHNNQLNQV